MKKFDAILVDAGTGNLHSVHNALLTLGFDIHITSDPDDLKRPGRVILPGVGAFGSFMNGLQKSGLVEALQLAVRRGDPLLGICVGMQAQMELGEEKGEFPGLGLLTGRVVRFPNFDTLKVPHTGWNQLWLQRESALFKKIPSGAYAYFNHSYYCAPADSEPVSVLTDYGIQFVSAVEYENLFGVQFHPEKSQQVGRQLLTNFMQIG